MTRLKYNPNIKYNELLSVKGKETRRLYRLRPEVIEREKKANAIYRNIPEIKEKRRVWKNKHYNNIKLNDKPKLYDMLRKQREYKRMVKIEVFYNYSNGDMKCQCCGESIFKFLSIDHINNDGGKHRKSLGLRGGHTYYMWLINNDFPPGYTVLCMNCNFGKGQNNGICPHLD